MARQNPAIATNAVPTNDSVNLLQITVGRYGLTGHLHLECECHSDGDEIAD